MKETGPLRVFLRAGYLLLGGWLVMFGVTNYLGVHHPIVIAALHLTVMLAGIAFLFSLSVMSRGELAGMIVLAIFLLAMGVIPFESAFQFRSGNLVAMILWGNSLLAGCLIPIGLAEKRWGDRLSLAFLSVWLIIWPIQAFTGERHIKLMFTALLPAVTGLAILANALIAVVRHRPNAA